ncbi:MAG TPA: methyltransferase domain-containing protein [Polyangiaceae bacterium]|nr:methyltransferase domain-containing protein [Polyangiaceae bacterium]
MRDLENVACYVCGITDSRPWAEENGFSAVRCVGCGLVYVNPRPTRSAISRAAQSGMHEGARTLDETGGRDGRKVGAYRRRLQALFAPSELAQRGSRVWLDFGCGFGEFLEALQLESDGQLSLRGSEPNERKATAARARGFAVSFRDLAQEERRYAFISMLNVFSHLPDPPQLLALLRCLLLPAGELLLQTGNWAELERSAIRDRLHLPDHLSFASESIIRRLLDAAGFQLLSVQRYPMFSGGFLRHLVPTRFRAENTTQPCDLWFRARLLEK